jgi:hypothetical protein
MPKGADAPDLGERLRRFQNITLRFKKQRMYVMKVRFVAIGFLFLNEE